LWVAELLAHALERPTHGGFVRFAADVHDGRQRLEKHLGMAAREREEAAGDVSRTFGDLRNVICLAEAIPRERVVDRFEREMQEKLNWKPTGPGLIADLDHMDYTQA
jgi:hypothetical protein